MNRGIVIRILLCIGVFGGCLYSYLDQQNQLTSLRLHIPVVAKEVKDLNEEDVRLQFEIDLFESPQHLMELMALSEYSHLKHPLTKHVVQLSEGIALQLPSGSVPQGDGDSSQAALVMGVAPYIHQ